MVGREMEQPFAKWPFATIVSSVFNTEYVHALGENSGGASRIFSKRMQKFLHAQLFLPLPNVRIFSEIRGSYSLLLSQR